MTLCNGCGIALTAIWVRERHRNKRTRQETARQDVEQLVTLVARQILDDRTIELTFPANPDGKYLLTSGTSAVWDAFNQPDKWRGRLGEGVIQGTRCGITQKHWSCFSEAKGSRWLTWCVW